MTLTEQILAAINVVAARCPSEARAARKLRQVVRENVANPLIPARLGILIDNARDADFSRTELAQLGQALEDLDEARDGKPGPPKQFPIRVDLRISAVEDDALKRISEQTGEERSEIIRRLAREASQKIF